MKKNFISISMVLVCLLLLVACSNDGEVIANRANDKDRYLLNKSYYENDDIAYFHCYNTGSQLLGKLNNWNIFNIIRLNKLIDDNYILDDKIISDLRSEIRSIDFFQNRLYNYYTCAMIEKEVFGYVEDKQKYLNFINQHRTGDIFYLNRQKENLADKIVATYYVLNIYKTIGYVPEEIEQIERALLGIINSGNYFDYDLGSNMKEKLLNSDLVLLIDLSLIDDINNNNGNLKTIAQKEKWIDFWYNKVINMNYNDVDFNLYFYSEAMQNFLQIYNYLGEEMYSQKVYNNIIQNIDINNLVRENFQSNFMFIYDLVFLVNLSHHQLAQETVDFIQHNYQYFYYQQPPITNSQDFYYLNLVAKKSNFDYDEAKVKEYISRMKYEEDNIGELYYYYEICKEHNLLDTAVKNDLKRCLENIKITRENSNNYKNIYYYLILCDAFNVQSKINEKDGWEDINNLLEQQVILEQIYYLYHISNLLNLKIDNQKIYEKVMDFYDNVNGGFIYFLDKEQKDIQPDVYATYFALDILQSSNHLNKLSKQEVSKIKSFIEQLKGVYGGYYPAIIEESEIDITSLSAESWFSALEILDIINESNY